MRVAGENSKTEPAKIHQSAHEITMFRKIMDAGKQCIDTTTINGTSCSDLIPVSEDTFKSVRHLGSQHNLASRLRKRLTEP